MEKKTKIVKAYVKCSICYHEISVSGFNKHLERHYDPRSRLCKFWYKEYFTRDRGVTVCALCDEEIHPEMRLSRMEYEHHLDKEHNIQKP